MCCFGHLWCECSKLKSLNPCKCSENIIRGNENCNLKHIFESVNQQLGDNEKHFAQFHLNNTAITELAENTFSEITFDKIHIDKALKLKLISTDAFTATNLLTKILHRNSCRKFCSKS
jgi:L-ribulose-5-phosphate 3-epimerase UlaE